MLWANPITVTQSSVGTSRHINLDWRGGGRKSFAITGSSLGSFAVMPEGTLDDLQLVASPSWFALSSSPLTANSSVWSLVGPYAGIRMNSSTLSSAALTLRILSDHGY
jgi:hypothetical protein